jgi:predicted MFS family arabinose efflux permease
LLLLDIARSFEVQVGTAGLTASVGAISGVVFGVLMAVLSVRFNHKMFLLAGLVCTCLAALGFFLAPNFLLLLVPNIGVGAGIAMVTAMAYSIIGDVYPLEKRGRAIGVIVSATTLAYVIGAPTIDLIAEWGGWRVVMIALSLPVTLISFGLAAMVIPKNLSHQSQEKKEPFSLGLKSAFSNRSTVAALAVTMLMISESGIGFYAVSFFREQFSMTIDGGAVFTIVGSSLGAVGGLVSGLLINRLGRKRLGTIAGVIAGLITVSFMFIPTYELSYGLGIARFWFSAMTFTAGGSLVIEQLPKFRSTMMSLNTAFMNLGILLASLTAAIVLNFQVIGLALGSLGILGAVVWILFVKEPVKTK